jgi:pimeloyl-ACP methyl ester carboxylesterase
VRERVATFGANGAIAGVITEPDLPGGACRPAVLLFNVGLNHHVGPHRFNVDLARHLAEYDFVSLRFDLSGLGDSEPRQDARSDEERAVLDVETAMDFLVQQRGIETFVLIGLCSGVDPAHAVAISDARVKGAVFIDGYAYKTRGYYLRLALDRVLRVFGMSNYERWFRRVLLPLFEDQHASTAESAPIFDRTFPPLAQFKSELNMMLGRGVRALFLYTRQAYFFNYRGQFAEMIGVSELPSGVEVEHQLGADHIFTSCVERTRAISLMTDWIHTSFGGALVSPTQNSSVVNAVATPLRVPQ